MVTNGQLSAMTPERRTAAIADLPPSTRRSLAHLASLGSAHRAKKAVEHLDAGRTAFARRVLEADVVRLAELSAELTGDDQSTTDHPTPAETASTIDALLATVAETGYVVQLLEGLSALSARLKKDFPS